VRSDAELVKAVLNGDKDAFGVLVKRYENPVRAAALDVVGHREKARDTAQEAFIKAYENLHSVRKGDAFGWWLLRITQRCALDSVRKEPRAGTIEACKIAAVENPDGHLEEDKQVLLAAVARLPDSEKEVVMLRYFAGHTVRDVAKVVGRSTGTVTKQLSRAHRRLRAILKEK